VIFSFGWCVCVCVYEMEKVGLEEAVRALHQEFVRVGGGNRLCVNCGHTFGEADPTLCSYHRGDWEPQEEPGAGGGGGGGGEVSLSGRFTCCKAQEELFWGGTPVYGPLLALVTPTQTEARWRCLSLTTTAPPTPIGG